MKAVKILAIAACLAMVLLMVTPTFAITGPPTQQLQYKFYYDQNTLFNALLNGDIDLMGWPLTESQYQTAAATLDITVAPVWGMNGLEIAYNNNATDLSHTADRKAMNYLEFRAAISCLVDKADLIGTLNDHSTRIDTKVPRPALDEWVNFDVSWDTDPLLPPPLLDLYPWKYNPSYALTILYYNEWYSHVTYPTFNDLFNAYLSGPGLPMGSVVYPPGHPRAGQSIDSLVGYIRSDHSPRYYYGTRFADQLVQIGISVTRINCRSGDCYDPVFIDRDYDFYTSAWSLGTRPDAGVPLQYYSMCTPVGMYPGGPNIYMISDIELTYWAKQAYLMSSSRANSIDACKKCQNITVYEAMFVELCTLNVYMAYRTGAVGIISTRGYGLTKELDFTFLNAKVSPYTSPMTVRYGTLNQPVQINPIFSDLLFDYQVLDRIFTSPIATNPYATCDAAGKSPAGGDLPWMAYDWNYQLSTFTGGGGQGDPGTVYTNMANVTFWFRQDITWHDGVPWTVEDFNYTIFLHKAYGDSYGYSDMIHVVNFVEINDWTCSLYFDVSSYWTLYTALYDQVPMHIYQYIAIPAGAAGGASTTGHHGYWPGAAAISGEVLLGAPFTLAQLTGTGGEQYTWIGTGMWKYVPDTLVPGWGGGLSLIPYDGFWMQIAPGEIDFKYTWNSGPAPQGGSYRIGLSDLVLLANAYGTSGTGAVPFIVGGSPPYINIWEPGCDIAPPAGVVGLSDLVTMALHYGLHWGYNP